MSANAASAEERANRTLDHAAYQRFLPMIRRIAMRLARRIPAHITVADLVGYGWIGLMEAYQRADAGMDPDQFEAYASYRVRGAMLDYLRSLDPSTRDLRRMSRKVTETIRALSARKGSAPGEEEIAAELGMDLEKYRTTLQRVSEEGMARLEVIDLDRLDVAEDEESVESDVGRKELGAVVADAITTLPERLQQVLALYYQEECTLKQIGLILGVTESRVSQLHSEAMHRLRARVGGA